MLDTQACYRALQTRDERFDGRFFVGVATTGIYCRPICPATTPKRRNCRFFTSAAAAHEAGFRPCLRCRPETGPDLATWRGTSNTVSRALALIAQGELDGSVSVDDLAERVGVGGRQLRRLFREHIGASPVTVAQTRRVLFAKQLIHETRLPMSEIALASGFSSLRRFNETFQDLFDRPPSALRRGSTLDPRKEPIRGRGVTVRLRYRPPYDWPTMLAHLRARAVDGVEWLDCETYHRTVLYAGQVGAVSVVHDAAARSLVVTIRFPSVRALPAIVENVRRVFDLGADTQAIGAHLARDRVLAPLVAARPGLRVPGGWDGFEWAARAVLGQQITVAAASALGGRLASLCGSAVPEGTGAPESLRRVFPTAEQVVRADLTDLAMPAARRRALLSVARAVLADPTLLRPEETIEQTVAKLRIVPGVGEWTAQTIALRAVREPDAFPATDRGLLRSAARRSRSLLSAAALLGRAERWRPWRGYAAQYLWTADAEAGSAHTGGRFES